jgi:hypothetical protein
MPSSLDRRLEDMERWLGVADKNPEEMTLAELHAAAVAAAREEPGNERLQRGIEALAAQLRRARG